MNIIIKGKRGGLMEERYLRDKVLVEITEEEDTNEEEVYRLLFRAIDKLPARCREIFLLHMDGKKNEEIATVLGISIETVKTQKKRAIQSIKEQMGTCYFLLPLCDILYSSKFFS